MELRGFRRTLIWPYLLPLQHSSWGRGTEEIHKWSHSV